LKVFVAAEILKSEVNQGELYYFRDQQGLEVDFLLPRPNAGLWLIECKAAKTVRPAMAAPLSSVDRALRGGLGAADDKDFSWEAHAIGGGILGKRGEHLLGHFEFQLF
jgi:predicted AAA+ superfamily ATPase